jgi:hypothetical protein
VPSVSKKQHNFMAAVANNPKFAKKAGVSQSVGEEFLKADKGRKFRKGGEMAESKKMVGKEIAFMKKKGAPKSMIKHEMEEMKGKKKMAFGGVSNMPTRDTSGFTNKPTPAKPGVTNKPTQGNRPGSLARFERKYGPLARIPEEGMDKPMAKGGKVKKMALGGTAGTKGVPTNYLPTPKGVPTNAPTPANPGYLSPPGGEGYAELNRPAKPGGFSTGVTNKLPPGSRPGNRPGNLGFGAGGPSPMRFIDMNEYLFRGATPMAKGGKAKKMANGGLAAGHKQADGIAKKGKTRGMEVKMAAGGLAAGHKQADGIAKKGKTKAMQIKMAGGGYKGC